LFNPYIAIIAASLIIVASYFFDVASKKFKIPSVLFLIFTGIGLKYGLAYYDLVVPESFFSILQLLGIFGLIMIVLEAALDLKISKDKVPLIRSSVALALFVLVITAFSIGGVIYYILVDEPFFNCLVYAIPLSVVSSAVLIPSVHTLTKKKKEFLIYESTFSDILGILFFNFVVLQEGSVLSWSGITMIVATVLFSIFVSYILVFVFSKIKTHVKLFLMIAILALLYALGKKLNLSTLLMIFIFGIVMNNAKIFYRGRLSKTINFDNVKSIRREFHTITAETAFVIRTFFFIAFGMSIDVMLLADPRVLVIGFIILVLLYLVRYVNFKVFLKTDVFPEIFLAPRGLITILLFFSIPLQFQIKDLSEGILFFVILGTSLIMMAAIMASKDSEMETTTLFDVGLGQASDYEIEYETFSEFDDLLDDVGNIKGNSDKKLNENNDNNNEPKGES